MTGGDSPGYTRLLERLDQIRVQGVAFGLGHMQTALERLGHPESACAVVHIAGTNGKGSTAAMTAAILQAAGWKTALFTSPHLSRFTERFRLGGAEIDSEVLAALDAEVLATGVPLTYFETATVLFWLAARQDGADVAVVEVGLGGRLDATNVCQPVATAITSIGLDHQDLLGTGVGDIAREKAGIVKAGVPVFVGPVPAEARAVIGAHGQAVGAPVHFRSASTHPPPVAPGLRGAHQANNAALATALAEFTARSLGRPLAEEAMVAGLEGVRWPGRLEWVGPDVLLDAAHNPQGVEGLVGSLPERGPRALVVSFVGGKALSTCAALLAPAFPHVVATMSRSERALPAAEVAAAFGAGPSAVVVEPDPLRALALARAQVAPRGFVTVAGSTFLVGEIRAHLLGEASDPVGGGDPLP